MLTLLWYQRTLEYWHDVYAIFLMPAVELAPTPLAEVPRPDAVTH